MNLSIYKFADIQKFRSVLVGLKNDGVSTLDEAILVLNGAVTETHNSLSGPPKASEKLIEHCPSCKKGIVSLWPRISAQVGGQVFGCKQCQWSEVR